MKIKYLTWLQEQTGKHDDNIDLPNHVDTIDHLMSYLEENKAECASIFKNRNVIYTAVNGEVQDQEFKINNTDQVSFFSAVVGG